MTMAMQQHSDSLQTKGLHGNGVVNPTGMGTDVAEIPLGWKQEPWEYRRDGICLCGNTIETI